MKIIAAGGYVQQLTTILDFTVFLSANWFEFTSYHSESWCKQRKSGFPSTQVL